MSRYEGWFTNIRLLQLSMTDLFYATKYNCKFVTSQTFSCLLPWLNQSEIRIFKIGATKNVSMNKMLLTRIEHNNAAAGVIWSIGVEWAEQVTTSGNLKIRLSWSEGRQCEDFNASMFESSHLNVWNLVSSMTFPSALDCKNWKQNVLPMVTDGIVWNVFLLLYCINMTMVLYCVRNSFEIVLDVSGAWWSWSGEYNGTLRPLISMCDMSCSDLMNSLKHTLQTTLNLSQALLEYSELKIFYNIFLCIILLCIHGITFRWNVSHFLANIFVEQITLLVLIIWECKCDNGSGWVVGAKSGLKMLHFV